MNIAKFIPKAVYKFIAKQAFSGSIGFRNEIMQGVGLFSAKYMHYKNNQNFLEALRCIPDIGEILIQLSSGYSRIGFRIEKTIIKNGKEEIELIDNHLALDKLRRPNPLQSGASFRYQSYFDRNLFGSSFYFALTRKDNFTYKDVEHLWIIPAAYTLPEWTGRMWEQLDKEGIIARYVMKFAGKDIPFETSKMLHIKYPDIEDMINGRSPLKGESWTISTMKALYESDNEVISNHGSMGMITSGEKDAAGIMPLNKDDIKDIQDDFSKYGLRWGRFKYMIARGALNYINMIAPIKDLQYDEKMQKYRMRFIDVFGFQKELMSSPTSDAKLTNRDAAMAALYTEKLIPDAWEEANELTIFLGLDKENMRFIPDVRAIEALQRNQKEKNVAYKTKNDALKIQYFSALITMNQWLVKLGDSKSGNKLADKYITELTPIELSIILGQIPITQPVSEQS